MNIKILNKVWKLLYVPNLKNYGECDSPSLKYKEIKIRSGMTSEKELEILIHELLHASAWKLLSEEFVEEASRDISRVLVKVGYKKEEK